LEIQSVSIVVDSAKLHDLKQTKTLCGPSKINKNKIMKLPSQTLPNLTLPEQT
jgi:hypothetical protein